MFCSGCGSPLPDNANVCPTCGKPAKKPAATQPSAAMPPTTPPPPPSPTAQPAFQQPPADAASSSQPFNLDISRIFTFAFQDKEWWKKCLILGLICLIPIIGGIVIIGYCIDVASRSSEERDTPLPDIDFGGHLSLGLNYFLYTFVLGLIAICPFIGLMIMGALMKNPFVMMFGQLMYLIMLLVLAFYLIIAYPVAISEKNPKLLLSFGRCFKTLTSNFANFLIGFVLFIALYIMSNIGVIACFVGVFITAPLSMMMAGNMIGQLSKLAK